MHLYQLSVLSVLAAAPLYNLAQSLSPLWQDRRVKHSWKTIPPNWESLGHPPPGTTIHLYIALRPHHEHALIDSLYDVSDPRSPNYGAHLSKEQVAQLVSPHPDTLELVYSWLRNNDIPSSSISTTHSGSCLKVTGLPVVQANELLGASYQRYQHTGTNDTTIIRTIGYELPTVLHEHVRTVIPTTHFASTHSPRPTSQRRSVGVTADSDMTSREVLSALSSHDIEITPEELRWLYRTVYYVPTATDKNKVGVAGFMNQYPSPADLTRFMKAYRTDAVHATFTVEHIDNNNYDPKNPGDEANLNIQWSQAIAYPTPHIFYSGGSESYAVPGTNEPAEVDMWADWLHYLLDKQEVSQTISISYGIPEKHLPLEYVTTLCDMFAQLGALGVSVLCASGDDGVGKGDCKVEDGSVRFEPEWPSSCPYITSVGGTTRKGQYPEIAANFSGGGFSDHFPREPYQNDAVTAFLRQLGNQYDGLYNAAGRGIPDISAQGLKFPMISNGEGFYMSGTSCSTPTVAGIISLLNDYLLSIGRKPLGFLNPWLYGQGSKGLNDITSGYNPGCGTDGFSAIAGWDPVTGLGTPDFLSLQSILLRMGYHA
ncbi:subtilisin-like protein [Lactarius quietus]|nr:subtilisin-like protein [Lactarius quietus]